MRKKNAFINVTASMGRGLLYAYLYIMFRPKIGYQRQKSQKRKLKKAESYWLAIMWDIMTDRCFICCLRTVSL